MTEKAVFAPGGPVFGMSKSARGAAFKKFLHKVLIVHIYLHNAGFGMVIDYSVKIVSKL